ncbi:tyrosine aminotransferase [Oopsacas minuta]|uniref:alanine transaminase n=1 Tax=Oopsacas minuta TaxID=111878 RepID=A0AAV7JJG2_9METZ|nr:tyrosine aminotransferase [Oopsacas minuta]
MICSVRFLSFRPPYFFTTYAVRSISIFRGSILRTPLTCDNLNSNVKKVEYAVRGPIPTRALQIESELISHPESFQFDKLIYVNIGDPQNLGQCPLTFPRQLLALCAYPALISKNSTLFPSDVLQRARNILDSTGSFGGYSHSLGFSFVRKSIANFILKRDHIRSDSTIILSDGASKIINVLLSCLSSNTASLPTGVMIPIPQYPLYTASLSYLGLFPIPYYLHEDSCWGFSIDDLSTTLKNHTDLSLPTAFVVINPGNPTGQCLDASQQLKILRFCYDNNLLLLADEVYQDNIYDKDVKWTSFRKVLLDNKTYQLGKILHLTSTVHATNLVDTLVCPTSLMAERFSYFPGLT